MNSTDMFPLRQDSLVGEWKQGIARQRGRQLLIGAVLLVLILLSAQRCGVDFGVFATGISKGLSLLTMFFPPDVSALPGMLQPIGVTLVMAFAATVFGTILSLPCALAASSNIAPQWLRYIMRIFIGFERGLPEILLLLLLVAAFGLGAFPGLVALSVSSIGMLAKLLADSIEEIEPQALESVAVTGATRAQVIRYAVIPQVLPSLLANALFRFEVNVRASVLLGAVGAGGIGYELNIAMFSLEYRRAATAIIASLSLVFISERVSDYFRVRILRGGQVR